MFNNLPPSVTVLKNDKKKENTYTGWLKKMDADGPFAQIVDSNDKCSSSLEVECWNEDETHAARQSATQF